MTRVDFYTLEADSPGDRWLLSCRLVERARQDGLRVLIHCPDAEQARSLDRLLWTYRQDSFIPHGLVGATDPVLSPVLIGGDGTPEREDQVLINLGTGVPAFFSRFQRVCEPVDQDPAVRAAARERFRCYRDQGHPPLHHPVSLRREDADAW
jgi:DNA polymerase III subunit chi